MQKAVQLLNFSNILFFQKKFRIINNYNNKTEPTVSVRSQLVGEHGYSAKLGDDNDGVLISVGKLMCRYFRHI